MQPQTRHPKTKPKTQSKTLARLNAFIVLLLSFFACCKFIEMFGIAIASLSLPVAIAIGVSFLLIALLSGLGTLLVYGENYKLNDPHWQDFKNRFHKNRWHLPALSWAWISALLKGGLATGVSVWAIFYTGHYFAFLVLPLWAAISIAAIAGIITTLVYLHKHAKETRFILIAADDSKDDINYVMLNRYKRDNTDPKKIHDFRNDTQVIKDWLIILGHAIGQATPVFLAFYLLLPTLSPLAAAGIFILSFLATGITTGRFYGKKYWALQITNSNLSGGYERIVDHDQTPTTSARPKPLDAGDKILLSFVAATKALLAVVGTISLFAAFSSIAFSEFFLSAAASPALIVVGAVVGVLIIFATFYVQYAVLESNRQTDLAKPNKANQNIEAVTTPTADDAPAVPLTQPTENTAAVVDLRDPASLAQYPGTFAQSPNGASAAGMEAASTMPRHQPPQPA